MTRADLLQFLRARRYAVQSSVSSEGAPQAAVIGIAVSDDFEIVFDTIETTRKARNLRRNDRIALVFGSLESDAAQTVQYEGDADRPAGAELEELREQYFQVFPDGRERLSVCGRRIHSSGSMDVMRTDRSVPMVARK